MNYDLDKVASEVEQIISQEFGVGVSVVIAKTGPNALIKVYLRNICLGYTSVYAVSDGTFVIGRQNNGCFSANLFDSVDTLLKQDFKDLENKVNQK